MTTTAFTIRVAVYLYELQTSANVGTHLVSVRDGNIEHVKKTLYEGEPRVRSRATRLVSHALEKE